MTSTNGRQLEFDPVTLDPVESTRVTEDAIAQNERRLREEWRDRVWLAIDFLCDTLGPGGRFTVDHVWEVLRKIPRSHSAASRMGPVIRGYAKETGRIAITGDYGMSARPARHKNLLREWQVLR
jgi:hypothetical protein